MSKPTRSKGQKMRIKDKIAIVTGSGQGIGRGIALALAKEGAKIVGTDVTDKIFDVIKEVQNLGSQGLAIKADVSSAGQVGEMVKKSIEQLGRIDILVNNAGIFPFKPLIEMTEADWDKVLDVNLKGVFNCTRAVVPHMINQKSGKIINIASIVGVVVGFAALTHYSASKGGMVGFTKSVALELAPFGINVNAIAPGSIETPGARMDVNAESVKQFLQAIPLKRIGQPDDIANAVLFLASDESSYITGQCLVVDGGYTIQ